jgi:hypothetical protein
MTDAQRSSRRVLLTTLAAATLCGCVNSRQAAIDDAYRRGEISYAERERRTDELNEQRFAELEKSHARAHQQVRRADGKQPMFPEHEEEPALDR